MLSRPNEQPLVFSFLKVSRLLLWMSFLLVIASLCFRKQVHVLVKYCVRKIFAYFPCANFLRYPLWYSQVFVHEGVYMWRAGCTKSSVFKDLCFYSVLMVWCWGPKINLVSMEETQSQHSLSYEGPGKGCVDEGDTKKSHMAASWLFE